MKEKLFGILLCAIVMRKFDMKRIKVINESLSDSSEKKITNYKIRLKSVRD